MISVNLKNVKNETVGSVELPEDVFNVRLHRHAMYEAVRSYLANQRQGTVKTKTRAEVRGGGTKPWRQKGTGRARAGSTRSPLWRHGGTTFGPRPRSHRIEIPKKVRRLALRSALSEKLRLEEITVLDEINLPDHRFKLLDEIIRNLGCERKTLIVEPFGNANLLCAAKNNRKLRVMAPEDLNTYEVLHADRILFTRQAIEKTGEMLKK